MAGKEKPKVQMTLHNLYGITILDKRELLGSYKLNDKTTLFQLAVAINRDLDETTSLTQETIDKIALEYAEDVIRNNANGVSGNYVDKEYHINGMKMSHATIELKVEHYSVKDLTRP